MSSRKEYYQIKYWFLVLFPTFIAVSCINSESERVVLEKHPNPYQSVFSNSQVKVLVGYDVYDNQIIDTIHLDKEGRVIERNSEFSLIRWEYDSNNYVKRLYLQSDVFDNRAISYEMKEDTLYQYWIWVSSPEWEYHLSDLDSNRMFVNKYLIKDGLPHKFIDANGSFHIYYYDDTKTLLKIDKYSNSGTLGSEVIYKYDSGSLSEVYTQQTNKRFYEKVYFGTNSLDSIVDTDSHRKYIVLEKYSE